MAKKKPSPKEPKIDMGSFQIDPEADKRRIKQAQIGAILICVIACILLCACVIGMPVLTETIKSIAAG